jgi:CPA2 family monovalent cation:H+ antiporter-2
MHDAHEFLRSLTVVLVVAAGTTVLFQRLRQPVVLGYIIAGMIVGPHVPVPIVADPEIVETLSELGVILLMFSLGLEFSLPKLLRVGPVAGVTAAIQCSAMTWLGFLVGRGFGWTTLECLFTGALIAVSSTTIIAKVFDEQRIGGHLRELVVGILLVEDLIAVVMMAALTGVASGAGLDAGALVATIGRLLGFLALLLVAGLLSVPRFMRMVLRIDRAETTLVAAIGICFATAWVAQQAGYSVALGAFLAGSLVAESGAAHAIERLVQPVRDVFAAIFFVAVGLLLDPALAWSQWPAVVVLTLVIVVGKTVSVAVGAFLTGNGTRVSIQAGMSLSQIGEFSFIIAALGLSLGATRDFVYPVAVAVSVVTTLLTPWLVRAAEPVAVRVDRRLPRRLQTLASLYGTWLERRRAAPVARASGVRRIARLLALDAALLAALIVGTSLGHAGLAAELERRMGVAGAWAEAAIVAGAALVAMPLVLGIGRLAHRLGRDVAREALPVAGGRPDTGAAPRRAFELTLQLGTALATAIVVVAVTQPFVPLYASASVLAAALLGLAWAWWRSAEELDSHVRAGAQGVLEALQTQARGGGRASRGATLLHDVEQLLPGLGTPTAIRLAGDSPAVGRTLGELDLRGHTGATVLAISRSGGAVLVPGSEDRLAEGDVLALAGTREAIDAARALLGE